MNYYFLEFQYPRKGFISGGVEFSPELDVNYSYIESNLPINTIAEVTLVSSVKKMDVDFFHTTSFALLVSDSLRLVLEEYISVQFIPTTVRYHNGEIVERKYWVIHNMKKIDCLDFESSEYAGKRLVLNSITNPPRKFAKGVRKVILDSSKIEGADFFKIEYSYIQNPVISERLYNILRGNKMKVNATPVGDFIP